LPAATDFNEGLVLTQRIEFSSADDGRKKLAKVAIVIALPQFSRKMPECHRQNCGALISKKSDHVSAGI